ncbi:MAG: hypothetical protein Q4F39_03140 [Bacteroidia bacterium]|nr:hypothetical protein [Bacteroidia bacterium]
MRAGRQRVHYLQAPEGFAPERDGGAADEDGTNYNQLKKANLWLRDSKLTNKNHRSYTVLIP